MLRQGGHFFMVTVPENNPQGRFCTLPLALLHAYMPPGVSLCTVVMGEVILHIAFCIVDIV